MEDLKAKQMISADHHFVSHQPRKKKKKNSVPEFFFKNWKIYDKKNPRIKYF